MTEVPLPRSLHSSVERSRGPTLKELRKESGLFPSVLLGRLAESIQGPGSGQWIGLWEGGVERTVRHLRPKELG